LAFEAGTMLAEQDCAHFVQRSDEDTEPAQVQSRPRNQRGQPLHDLLRRRHLVRGAAARVGLGLRPHLADGVASRVHVGNRRTGAS
jgi:hypothetical protein